MRRRLFIALVLVGQIPIVTTAQGDVWDRVQKAQSKTDGMAGRRKSALTRWKDHLQTWGVDTVYNREAGLLGRLNSDGWTGGAFYGWKGNKPGIKTFLQLSFSEVKDEKQVKQKRENSTFPGLGPATPYVYGKIANLYTLNLGMGREKVLLPGILDGNINIGLRWSSGFSLAVLKPYYLRLMDVDYNTIPTTAVENTVRYSEDNSKAFLNTSGILGAAKWENGLEELTCIPGLYGEASLTIEPLRNQIFIKNVSLGINATIYSRQTTIMVERESTAHSVRLFASLQFGKRWK